MSISNLIAFYNGCDEKDVFHDVAGKVLDNLDKMRDLGIGKLASLCFVSPATISRFCKKIGYDSFVSFKRSMSSARHNHAFEGSIIPQNSIAENEDEIDAYYRAVMQTAQVLSHSFNREEVSHFTDALRSCKRVSFFAINMPKCVIDLQALLILDKKHVTAHTARALQWKDAQSLGLGDMACLIKTSSGNDSYLESIYKITAESGALTSYITNVRQSCLLDKVDYPWYFDGTLHRVDNIATEMVMQVLTIFYKNKYMSVPYPTVEIPSAKII